MKSKRVGTEFLVLLLVFVFSGLAGAVQKPTVEPDSCVTAECHGEYAKKKFLHGPLEDGECDTCHESADPEKHTYTLAEVGSELCESCHFEQTEGKNIHKPLKDGDCMQCHDPHAADNKLLLLKDKVSDVCIGCHKNVTEAEHLHGPVAVGQCSVCHDAHSSDHDHLLSVDPKELCISCHTTTKKEMEKFEFVHKATDGQCFGCHDPHGADNWKMLRAKAPELCYSCHEDIKKTTGSAKHKHGAIDNEGSCSQCHTPHASSVKYLLKEAPTKLCLKCHGKPLKVSEDDEIPAFTTQIEGKKFLHGPVDDDDCSSCHKTHGSDHFRMLETEYPAGFYASFAKDDYALCFGCHEDTLVLDAKTKDLTDFRNGDVNLHFLHVNKDRRGRTCRACHQTHASNLPKHIRKDVPYGAWDLPIGFSKSETGGTCAPGCHVKKDYDRDKPVDYTPKPKPKPKPVKKEIKASSATVGPVVPE